MKNFEENGFPDVSYKFQENQEGFSYFYFENNSDDTFFECKIRFAKLGGCSLRKSTK